MLRKTIITVLSTCFFSFAYAEQRVQANEYQAQSANISKEQLSSISIDGGRIAHLKYLDGDLEVDHDAQTGQVFVRALNNRTSTVFVISENGQTYLLQLSPKSRNGDSIIIDVRQKIADAQKANGFAQRPPRSITNNSNSYETAIKQFIRAVLTGKTDEFGVMRHLVPYETVPLWKNTIFTRVNRFVAEDMQATVYQLTNTDKHSLIIREQEFYKRGVYAVAVKKQVLAPGEMAEVVVIERLGD